MDGGAQVKIFVYRARLVSAHTVKGYSLRSHQDAPSVPRQQ
jgi:hypothetical protein